MLCETRHYLGMCCRFPFLGGRIGQGQKITQRCVAAWAGAFPVNRSIQRISGSGVSENAGGGSLGFWVNLFKASLSGLNRKSLFNHIRWCHWVFPREAGITILRTRCIAPILFPDRPIKAIQGNEFQAINSQMVAHLFFGHGGRQQFFALRRVHTIKTGPCSWGRGNTEMHLGCTCIRIISLILRDVVPRTTESSTKMIRFPLTNARLTFSFRRTPMFRICSVGSIKVRPMYWFE